MEWAGSAFGGANGGANGGGGVQPGEYGPFCWFFGFYFKFFRWRSTRCWSRRRLATVQSNSPYYKYTERRKHSTTRRWRQWKWCGRLYQYPSAIVSFSESTFFLKLKFKMLSQSFSAGKSHNHEDTEPSGLSNFQICNMPRDLGHNRCGKPLWSHRFHFDQKTSRCLSFWFLGWVQYCELNLNFVVFRCGGNYWCSQVRKLTFLGGQVGCKIVAQEIFVWSFWAKEYATFPIDQKSRLLNQFSGNLNRFKNIEECQQQCFGQSRHSTHQIF